MSDCISRQMAIDAIDKIFPNDPMKSEYTQGITCGAALAEEYIKQLPSAEPEPKWIPCSERLPEEDGQYLITVKYKHVDGYDDVYAEHGDWDNGKWDMFNFGHCGEVEGILAWMPLPEPYKGGEQNGSD